MKKYIKQIAAKISLRSFRKDKRGQDLIEYALIVGFMVIAVYVVLPNNLMPTVSNIFSRIVVIFGTAGS